MAYGSRVRRQGRSRPAVLNHSSKSGSSIQPSLLEIEVANDAAHDRVVDALVSPQLENSVSFGIEQLSHEALEVGGAALGGSVAVRVEATAEALTTEAEHAA